MYQLLMQLPVIEGKIITAWAGENSLAAVYVYSAFKGPEFNSQDPCDRRKELASIGCLWTSIGASHPYDPNTKYIHVIKLKKSDFF